MVRTVEGLCLCVFYSVMSLSVDAGNHLHSFTFGFLCVCPGVEGGAVKVTGAKGCAPPHDYKVKSHMH